MSDDRHDWEVEQERLFVDVVLVVILYGHNDVGQPQIKIGLLNNNGELTLPAKAVTHTHYATEQAVALIREMVGVPIEQLTVLPVDFFDPINQNTPLDERKNRKLLLGYRVYITPGMPVNNKLEFYDYEGLELARSRISKSHARVFRAALNTSR